MNTTSKIVIKVITKLYTVPYPGVSLDTPVLCKGSIYTNNTWVAATDIHKVFNSTILGVLLRLNSEKM